MDDRNFAASTNARSSSFACFAPTPINITGFLLLLINLTAFLMSLYFGDTTVGLDVSTGLFVVSLIFQLISR